MAVRRGVRAADGAGAAGSGERPVVDARVVIIHGDEPFLLEEQTRSLTRALDAAFGGADVVRFQGGSTDSAAVLDECRTTGLLAPHKVVLVEDADRLVIGTKGAAGAAAADDDDGGALDVEGDAAAEAGVATGAARGGGRKPARGSRAPATPRQLFERYAESPCPTATLVLRAQSWRTGRLDALCRVIACNTLDARGAAGWCVERCRSAHGASIESGAAALLVERLGVSLHQLDSELGKLAAFAGAGGTISRHAVADLVGVSREEKAWEIQAPLLAGDTGRTLAVARELLDISEVPEEVLMWTIIDLLRRTTRVAHLLRGGASDGDIRSSERLWGESGARLIERARRVDPDRLTDLLHAALETDRAGKSGMGSRERQMELILVRIAGTMHAGHG